MLAGVLLDRPVSHSVSNKFKTLPQFIVDIFITQDTHVYWYDIMIIRLIRWSGPSCRPLETATQRTAFLSVFQELAEHRQRH